MSERKAFRGFGLGIMKRLRGTPTDEHDLVIRECRKLINGGVFYDVGANVGEVSAAILPFASKIIAIEPEPPTFKQLETRLGSRAICINALVGPDGDERTFLANALSNKSSMSVAPGDEPHGHYLTPTAMQAVSLDTLAKTHGMPDLLKIDTEGFEISILKSAPAVLASRPVVVMEFNAVCLSNFGRINPRDAIDYVCATFPKVEVITQDGRKPVTDPYVFIYNHILHHASVDNLVCSWD